MSLCVASSRAMRHVNWQGRLPLVLEEEENPLGDEVLSLESIKAIQQALAAIEHYLQILDRVPVSFEDDHDELEAFLLPEARLEMVLAWAGWWTCFDAAEVGESATLVLPDVKCS